MKSEEMYREIQKNILNGEKVPHGTSQPVIYYEDGKYYIAVFVFFYTKEDIDSGMISRPSFWAIMDIDTGEIVERRRTEQSDFSDAGYDIKYNVRSDGKYDTSREYYERAFAILDIVRKKIIEDGILLKEEYQSYLDMILNNIPREYQRFYRDLSIRCDDKTITEKEGKDNMETGKVENAAEEVQAALEADSTEKAALEADISAEEPIIEASGEKEAEKAGESSEAILKALEGLQKEFKEKLLVDQHKNQLIDKLHDEVVQYQNGVVNKVVDTMAIDIIQLADNVRKTQSVYSEKEASAENFTKLLRVVKGLYEDLQDILYRQGIEPYTVEGHDVDPRRQTIIASVPTDDESKHNKIASRTAEGYEREDGSVLRRERVKIFKFQSE